MRQIILFSFFILAGITSFSQANYKIKAETVEVTGNLKAANLATGGSAPVTSGTTKMVITDANGQLSFTNMPAGSGTVTSIGLTTPSWLTVTGSPVTTSGTLDVTATTGQTANQFLASPNGSTGAVGLRSIVAADIPTLDAGKITTGTMAAARLGSGTADANAYLGGDQAYHSASITKGVNFTSPTASENILIWRTPVAITVTSAYVTVAGSSPSVTYALHYGSSYGTSSGTIVASATVTTSGAATLNTTSIPANSFIWVVTTAASGTINTFYPQITFRQ